MNIAVVSKRLIALRAQQGPSVVLHTGTAQPSAPPSVPVAVYVWVLGS